MIGALSLGVAGSAYLLCTMTTLTFEHPVDVVPTTGRPALRISGPGVEPTVRPLARGKVAIGSSPSCQVVLPGEAARPLQCLLTLEADVATVTRWAAGVLLNGRDFRSASLQSGDKLSVGPWLIEVTGVAAAKGPAPSPVAVESERRQAAQAPDEAPVAVAPQATAAGVSSDDPAINSAPQAAFGDRLVLELWQSRFSTRERCRRLIAASRDAKRQLDTARSALERAAQDLAEARQSQVATTMLVPTPVQPAAPSRSPADEELLKRLEVEVASLADRLQAAEKAAEDARGELAAELAERQRLTGELETALAAQRAAESEANSTGDQLGDLETKLKHLADELSTARDELASRGVELAESQAACRLLADELRNLIHAPAEIRQSAPADEPPSEHATQVSDFSAPSAGSETSVAAETDSLSSADAAAAGTPVAELATTASGDTAVVAWPDPSGAAKASDADAGPSDLTASEAEWRSTWSDVPAGPDSSVEPPSDVVAEPALEWAVESTAEPQPYESDAVPAEPAHFDERSSVAGEPNGLESTGLSSTMTPRQETRSESAPDRSAGFGALEGEEARTPAETNSFIERYRHLLEQEDDASAGDNRVAGSRLLDAEFQPARGTTPDHDQAEDGDAALEDYMAQMMARVRSTSGTASSYSPTPQESNRSVSVPAEVQVAAPAAPAPESESLSESELLAELPAPKSQRGPASDLAAMRALARQSATKAIGSHRERRHVEAAFGQVLMCGASAIGASLLMSSSPAVDSYKFWAGIAAGVVGVWSALKLIGVSRRRDADRSEFSVRDSERS
jgi:hypothetical protein